MERGFTELQFAYKDCSESDILETILIFLFVVFRVKEETFLVFRVCLCFMFVC